MPNYKQANIPVPSGLNIAQWREKLASYHDTELVEFLEYGWPSDYTALNTPTATTNNQAKDPAQLTAIRHYIATKL